MNYTHFIFLILCITFLIFQLCEYYFSSCSMQLEIRCRVLCLIMRCNSNNEMYIKYALPHAEGTRAHLFSQLSVKWEPKASSVVLKVQVVNLLYQTTTSIVNSVLVSSLETLRSSPTIPVAINFSRTYLLRGILCNILHFNIILRNSSNCVILTSNMYVVFCLSHKYQKSFFKLK